MVCTFVWFLRLAFVSKFFFLSRRSFISFFFQVLGCNLLKMIIKSNYQGLPLEHVRTITRHVLEGLQYLHENCRIIHTDMKPENVLVTLSRDQIRQVFFHILFLFNVHYTGCF